MKKRRNGCALLLILILLLLPLRKQYKLITEHSLRFRSHEFSSLSRRMKQLCPVETLYCSLIMEKLRKTMAMPLYMGPTWLL